jgi:hypothetical protein
MKFNGFFLTLSYKGGKVGMKARGIKANDFIGSKVMNLKGSSSKAAQSRLYGLRVKG